MVAASTGNVAISYSAYAARAGVKLWAFVTSLVPEVKMREIALYGSQVVKVTGSYDQAKQVARRICAPAQSLSGSRCQDHHLGGGDEDDRI